MIFLVFIKLVSVGIDEAVSKKRILADLIEFPSDLCLNRLDGLLWGNNVLDLHEDVFDLDVGLFVHWGVF